MVNSVTYNNLSAGRLIELLAAVVASAVSVNPEASIISFFTTAKTAIQSLYFSKLVKLVVVLSVIVRTAVSNPKSEVATH